jgi:F420-dependent oxidoreductase-like protein
MRIGLQVPNFTWPGGQAQIGATLADIAHTVDESGFYSLWVMDHFFQIGGVGPVEHEMLEGYSTLSYLAALTKNVKLGTMVTGVVYRYPGILVKTATTLDVLSGGRAYLGIGAAWFEREAQGLGVPFPSVKERFERLEETLQIAKQMWSGEVKPYQGQHYQLAETLCSPMPLSKPHPPILIGGLGEKKTPRLIAKYADGCNLFARAGAEVIQTRFDTIKRYCDEFGRDYETIERTSLDTVFIAAGQMSAADVIARCKTLADWGFQQAIFNMPNVHEIKPLEVFAKEIIPAVSGF